MSVTPGMPEHMSLGDRLSRLEKQVAKLNRARKLQSASIGSGGLKIKDDGSVQFVATDGTVILEIDKSAFTYDRADGSRILEVTPAGGLKIYETDGTTERVVLDGDGLEINGGAARALEVLRYGDAAFNETVTTSWGTVTSVTVEPPSWAEEMILWHSLGCQMTDSGINVTTGFRVDTEAEFSTLENKVDGTVAHTTQGSITEGTTGISLPTDFDIEGRAQVSAGSNSSNVFRLTVVAMFMRTVD